MSRDEFFHRQTINCNGVVRRALAHLELENQVTRGCIFGNIKFADIIFFRACRDAQAVQGTITFFLRAVVIADLEIKSLVRRNTCCNLVVCPCFQLCFGIYEKSRVPHTGFRCRNCTDHKSRSIDRLYIALVMFLSGCQFRKTNFCITVFVRLGIGDCRISKGIRQNRSAFPVDHFSDLKVTHCNVISFGVSGIAKLEFEGQRSVDSFRYKGIVDSRCDTCRQVLAIQCSIGLFFCAAEADLIRLILLRGDIEDNGIFLAFFRCDSGIDQHAGLPDFPAIGRSLRDIQGRTGPIGRNTLGITV